MLKALLAKLLKTLEVSIHKHNAMNKAKLGNYLAIGIDTGKNGGICIISGTNMVTMKCPLTIHSMTDIIRDFKDIEKDIPIICCIEKNHSMPKQGVKSTWTFAYNSGAWEAILCSFNIPYILVPPKRWMSHYTIPKMDKPQRKKYLKELAIRLYPHHKKQITLATCDAILIAKYAVEKHIK